MTPSELADVFPWAAYYCDAYYTEAVLAVFSSREAAISAIKLYSANLGSDECVSLKRTADLSPDLSARLVG